MKTCIYSPYVPKHFGGGEKYLFTVAEVFAKQGANVAFTYNSSVEAAETLEKELQAYGVKAKGYKSNAANFDEAQTLAANVLKEFGTIDILINNAGITKDNLLMRISEEDFDKVIEPAPKNWNQKA